MALAIFNPFCCCTAAGLLGDAGATSVATTVVPSCCSQGLAVEGAGENAPAQSEHDSENCPHKAMKEYQASVEHDVKAAHVSVDLLPALYVLFDLMESHSPAGSVVSRVCETSVSMGDPPSLSQMYCVYRI